MRNQFKPFSALRIGNAAVSLVFFTGLLTIFCLMVLGNTANAQWSVNTPLMPTGNSTQDTENLQQALHHSNLDDGGTLYLGPGTFLVHSSLVRQAKYSNSFGYKAASFNGTIKGAGKRVTIIKSVRGPSGEDFTLYRDRFYNSKTPSTFIIYDEDYLGLRDMTFEADSDIADWKLPFKYYGYPAGTPMNSLSAFVKTGSRIYGEGNQIGIDCINVYFKGSLNNSNQPDMNHLFLCNGSNGGTYTVRSCDFENARGEMLALWKLDHGKINVGGSPNEKVTFKNAVNTSLEIWDGDCTINVSNIETQDAPGLRFQADSAHNTSSSINITNSDIIVRKHSDFAGVELWNAQWHNGDVYAEISKNNIHCDSSLWGPIFTEGVKYAKITNNRITGMGVAAIRLGSWYRWRWPGSAYLKGNNLDNWQTIANPYGVTFAPIWLGPFITNSVVIGGSNIVNVFDQPGLDWDRNWLPLDQDGNAQTYEDWNLRENIVPKNNIFTGVNNMHINLGQIDEMNPAQPMEKKLSRY